MFFGNKDKEIMEEKLRWDSTLKEISEKKKQEEATKQAELKSLQDANRDLNAQLKELKKLHQEEKEQHENGYRQLQAEYATWKQAFEQIKSHLKALRKLNTCTSNETSNISRIQGQIPAQIDALHTNTASTNNQTLEELRKIIQGEIYVFRLVIEKFCQATHLSLEQEQEKEPLFEYKCAVCGYEWRTRKQNPRECANKGCRSLKWKRN